MIITYNNTLRNTEEKLHKIRPVILELAESQVDLKHLHGILQELADATAPIEQRGKRNFDRKRKMKCYQSLQKNLCRLKNLWFNQKALTTEKETI